MFDKQSKLFTDPKIVYPIYNLNLNFTDYIEQCKLLITNTRVDLKQNTAQQIIDANTPFELQPSHNQKTKLKYGALLIHGLLDSPFQLRDIGLDLQSQGTLVRSILLPGHGTVPGALLNVDYHQWLQTVRYGIATLAKEVEQIFLVGNSTGASLSLYQAALDGTKIAGIILLSPALKIRSLFAPISNWYRPLSQFWKRAAWLNIDPEETIDYTKYRSVALNAVYQVYKLSQEINKNPSFSEPTCPLFFALSQDDKIVCAETIINYFHQHTNPKSRLLLYSNQTTLFNDSRIVIRPAAYPDLNIKNFSHITIPIDPNNLHYGKNGDFRDASHVETKSNIVFGEYNRIELIINKLLCQFNLTKISYQRLTFNPDFYFLTQSINQFIKSI